MNTADLRDQITAYRKSLQEILAEFDTDGHRGLHDADARARLERYGSNQLIAEKPAPAWKRFFAQFRDPLVILLLIATAISASLWLYERESAIPYEAITILAVVLLNTLWGTSRKRAQNPHRRQMAAAHAHVLRDGEQREIKDKRTTQF